MREWISMNGRLMPADQARVSVFDSGFLQGIGLFETMRAYNGVVFRLEQHLARLRDSARSLGWACVPEVDDLCANVVQVVGASEQSAARVRLTVTSGSLRATGDEPPDLTIVASASDVLAYPPELYKMGATVIVSSHRQPDADPTAGHKTTSMFSRIASLREAHAAGAHEAIWLTYDDLLAEGAISNVFVVRDGIVKTPVLDTPVLPGITRAAVMSIALAAGLPVEECELTMQDFLDADEAFLTNSMMEIVPVVRCQRDAIGDETPGDVTRQLYELYGDVVDQECSDVDA